MKVTKLAIGIVAAVFAALFASALVGCSSCSSGGATATIVPGGGEAQGITVSASSDTKVVPDKARVSVSVVSEGKTAEECQADNNTSVNAVIEALKKLGVEEKSIQTRYSDLSPRYGSQTTDAKGDDDGKEATVDEWVITGYEMTTSLTISDLEIDNVGAAVSACVTAGANDTNGIEYYASNYDEVYNDALAAALETAKGKADRIAEATGAKVGAVVNVSEGYQDTSARYVSSANEMYAMAEDADAGSVAKTMPGEVAISAQVTVTYAIG